MQLFSFHRISACYAGAKMKFSGSKPLKNNPTRLTTDWWPRWRIKHTCLPTNFVDGLFSFYILSHMSSLLQSLHQNVLVVQRFHPSCRLYCYKSVVQELILYIQSKIVFKHPQAFFHNLNHTVKPGFFACPENYFRSPLTTKTHLFAFSPPPKSYGSVWLVQF